MTAPLIGNARAVAAVQRALAGGAPPHAWLFVGPDGVGKAALARWLARALNCERNVIDAGGVGAHHDALRVGVEPCGECAQCDRIARGIHSDVITVSIPAPEPNEPVHKDISVDQVREVERAAALAPFEGRTRVVIIDPADAMSIGAQNAFLKTLEEPPPSTAFVLIATREDRLLETVRSRCRRIEFTLVPLGEIEAALKSLTPGPSSFGGRTSPEAREGGGKSGPKGPVPHSDGIDSERARLLARLASGRPGRALELAENPSRVEKRREVLAEARELGSLPMADLMDVSERLATRFREGREAVLSRLEEWLGWWRDLVLVQSGAEEAIVNVDLLEGLREDCGRYEARDVVGFVQALAECRQRLEGNVQARIALDALMVRVPRATSRAR